MKKGILENVKSIMRKSKSNRAIKIAKTFAITALLLTTAIPVAATTDTTAIDTIVDFFASWITKIGLVVAFFGGCQVGFAFKNDDIEVLKYFLENNLDIVNDKNYEEKTALHIACGNGNLEQVKLLISKGVDINAVDI